MHMADALISPVVGGAMWAATACIVVHSAKKLKEDTDNHKIPLMGVLGAFIFAAQMINFTIPATGSSGHIGGGMILAILLGSNAAFLVMASVLTIQALFFADGGLLALGCNVFNLGFFSCFLAYPLIYKKLAGQKPNQKRIFISATAASIVGLQMGALGVVLETWFSGISELPLTSFLLLMQPIHLAIGIGEGLVTAAVVTFIWKARPELLEIADTQMAGRSISMKKILIGFAVLAAIIGGTLSWFASANPDGLEWAVFRSSGKELKPPETGLHALFAKIQEKVALLPDYSFKKDEPAGDKEAEAGSGEDETWPSVSAGKSISGLIGGAMTLILACVLGFCLRRFRNRS
jgi:cobalt/nickel transport system permease protein